MAKRNPEEDLTWRLFEVSLNVAKVVARLKLQDIQNQKNRVRR